MQANDSVLVTPGSGATMATQLVNAKEYQVVCVADKNGQILGSRDTYIYPIASQVHVAAANTIHWDLFNASTSIVRVTSIRQLPNVTTAVTGVVFDWQLFRTSAVGTGGTAQSVWLPDSTQTALSASITCRSKPTAGATTSGSSLFNYSINAEETTVATIFLASMGGLELVPKSLLTADGSMAGIVLRQNEGLKCVQVTNSVAGNTGWMITLTVE